MKDEGAEDERSEKARELIANAHESDAAGRTGDGAEDRDIGVCGRLQQCEAGADDEEAGEGAAIDAGGGEVAEQNRADGHDGQAQRHAAFHSGGAQDGGGGKGEEEVRQVEGHRHEKGVHVVEIEGEFDEGDQRAVEPRDEAKDEKEKADGDHRPQGVLFVCGGCGAHASAFGRLVVADVAVEIDIRRAGGAAAGGDLREFGLGAGGFILGQVGFAKVGASNDEVWILG